MVRILVVDDDRDLTDVVSEILNEGGHDVTSCNSGDVALSCIVSEQPDLVILDVRLDGQPETGWKIIDQLRDNPLTAATPVIVSSGAQDALRAREAWLEERRISVLPKPFDMDDLLGLVEEVMSDERSTTPGVKA